MIDELSIIIPTLNEENYIPDLLKSIAVQNFHGKLQVIIVDGHSEDKTKKVVETFKSQISDLMLVESTRGIAHQRNTGVIYAKYKYILFIDADIVLPPNCLNSLLQKINPNDRFIASVLLWSTGKNILDTLTLAIAYPLALLIVIIDHITPGGFLFTTKQNHERIHGFNEKITFGEDIDYGKRSIADGAVYRLFLHPIVYHSPRRAREMGRVNFLLYWLRMYLYIKKHGVIKDSAKFPYRFGHYKNKES